MRLGSSPLSVRHAWATTLLSTETRVTCGDAGSRVELRLYWLVVRPFSGLLRRIMLGEIRRVAEARDA